MKTNRDMAVKRVTLIMGYTIVALAVVGGFVLSFCPQLFGVKESNPAIGFGLAALAAFRLYALRKELQRQAAESGSGMPARARPRGR